MPTAEEIITGILQTRNPETHSIDWIRNLENRDKIGQKIAAFATSGGGFLVVGIDDQDRALVDIGDEQQFITTLGEILRLCEPVPSYRGPDFITRDGKKIAVVQIVGLGGQVCFYKDAPYHRIQDSATRMKQADLFRIWQISGKISWESRPSPAQRSDLSDEEIEFYLRNASNRGPVNADAFLLTNNAIIKEGIPTNLGLIALGKKPADFYQHMRVQLVRFRGNDPVDRIAATLIDGPIRKLLEGAENFIFLNLPVHERFIGTRRIEEPVIPARVIREALVNLVVHRDYEDQQEALIRIFDDRIEFQNPGAPPPEVLSRILIEGIPSHRNQGLYNFLRPLHKAEAAGQGIPIMRDEMRLAGLRQPVITSFQNIFHLKLNYEKAPHSELLTDKILEFAHDSEVITTTQVMNKFGISRPFAIKLLNILVNQGVLEHSGKFKASRYRMQHKI